VSVSAPSVHDGDVQRLTALVMVQHTLRDLGRLLNATRWRSCSAPISDIAQRSLLDRG